MTAAPDSTRASRRRAVPWVVAAAVALLLSSCGGDGGVDDPVAAEPTVRTEASAEPESDGATPVEDEAAAPDETAEPPEQSAEPLSEAEETGVPAPGVYRDYSPEALAEPGYDQHIIFFHASWCPECRAFEQAIESGTIPAGVQILKVDYDAASDLKERYGVTIQTTFVQVDADGEEIASWVGYGKDRSIETLLDELG